ncbi:MAG: hypothetical protein KZQ59_12060 [Candidatus Thiodiazotropha sp. (ex Lucinoma aequizonata)]|nr:hypothetical protein [Candidatus Thiodiazotropha sp. (ex Lucinoma aequizonata)]MCU7897811.1 hypothetical protein [Candidatus Thiodiazotropha sp. (ex Lucinoma aequizonata)]
MPFISPFRSPFRPYNRAYAYRGLTAFTPLSMAVSGRWIHERQADDGQAFRGNGKRTQEQEEIKRLKSKIKRLEVEKEILKKATVFFAAETK